MIDICYYIHQIDEEIDGAKDYIKRAISYKTDHPDWAVLYYKMSEAELNHASNLMKIFEDDFNKNKTDDPIYISVHNELSNNYVEKTTIVKHMFDIYNTK